MSAPAAGPFLVVTAEDAGDLDARLPQPNSCRRASDESKMAVAAAHGLLKVPGAAPTDRTGIYVGQQQVSLDYCQRFVDQSYKDGPRMASPMLFADSVANSIATHLSLSLGFRGSAQTFIGTRAAGLQAALAAAEDVATGAVDQALVVVLGTGTELTRRGYHAVYSPRSRGRNLPEFPVQRGAAAFWIRPAAAGQALLLGGGLRCEGRDGAAAARSLAALAASAARRARPGSRSVESLFRLAEGPGRRALREAGLEVPASPSRPEAFALDPILRLLDDSASAPGGEGRVCWCLGEDGTAAWLAFDGPLARLHPGSV